MKITKIIFLLIFIIQFSLCQKILIPMDFSQKDHLKAYGIAFDILTKNINVEWLLNYRGGSFMVDEYPFIPQECRIRGVSFERVYEGDV
jgi:hypothetical protein